MDTYVELHLFHLMFYLLISLTAFNASFSVDNDTYFI